VVFKAKQKANVATVFIETKAYPVTHEVQATYIDVAAAADVAVVVPLHVAQLEIPDGLAAVPAPVAVQAIGAPTVLMKYPAETVWHVSPVEAYEHDVHPVPHVTHVGVAATLVFNAHPGAQAKANVAL